MSTEQQEEDDFHLEEVRGSHSTKVLMSDDEWESIKESVAAIQLRY